MARSLTDFYQKMQIKEEYNLEEIEDYIKCINKYYKDIADFEGLSIEYLTSFDIKNLTDDEIKSVKSA